MSLNTWLLYLVASVGLSLAPGPNGLLALTHGALYGSRKTLFTISGGVLGFALLIALSMFGIGALLKSSLTLFAVLKWVGAAYLVWLGIQLWRAPPITAGMTAASPHVATGRALFRHGLLTAITNPKALIFFAAFLPHFIDPERNLVLQFVLLAGTFMATEFTYEYIIAAAAGRIRNWLARTGRTFNRVCGGVFVVIGVALASES